LKLRFGSRSLLARDNALKFGETAEITIATGHDGQTTVCVLARGTGLAG
jgi:hypothetical protein